jgi:hypothetical protein
MRRLVPLLAALLAALAVAGCGNKEETAIKADTEGIYVGVDGLTYQVQISRILNPADVEDVSYLKGIPDTESEPTKDEVWFGVFMRVENENDDAAPLTPTDGFKITDTQGTVFEPVELDPDQNPFAYAPQPLPGGVNAVLPVAGSAASDNTIQGSLVLFKVKVQSLYNRPLELEIESQNGGDNAVIDIDV